MKKGEPDQGHQEHRRQAHRRPAGLDERPHHPREGAQGPLKEFPDQPAAFQALLQGQVDAYTNDGVQLAGLKLKTPNPAQWEVVGDFYSYEPYGMATRRNDDDFRNVVNGALMDGIESGKFFEIYEKWFGPGASIGYGSSPLTPNHFS